VQSTFDYTVPQATANDTRRESRLPPAWAIMVGLTVMCGCSSVDRVLASEAYGHPPHLSQSDYRSFLELRL